MSIQNLQSLGWNQYFQSQLSLEAFEQQLPFRVMAVQRNRLELQGLDAHQQAQNVALSTYPWRHETPEAHPTVGDWVMLDRNLEALWMLQRQSVLQRRRAGRESAVQLLAANIDRLFIVTSCNEDFSVNRIERYLALAEESHIESVLVLTKTDLCESPQPYLQELENRLPTLPVECLNATDPEALSALQTWIEPGQTVALLGSSGVGKSTLTNGLMGVGAQTTAAIRDSDSKGRHTTTARSLHFIANGGLLIDTPGMRELQLLETESGLRSSFADIEKLAEHCRFSDCQHDAEPGCAVLAAIEAGELEHSRLVNFRKLLAEQSRNQASLAEKRQQDRELGRFYKSALASSRKFKSRE